MSYLHDFRLTLRSICLQNVPAGHCTYMSYIFFANHDSYFRRVCTSSRICSPSTSKPGR